MSTPIFSGPRAYPHVKLVWGSHDVIKAGWRLGLFGFYSRIPGFPRSGLAISMRGAVRWALALTVVGYFAVALVVARQFAKSPFNQVQFFDVLTWPVRRERVAELRGRAWLAQGNAAVEARRWGEGFFLLRLGLDRCPDDFEARLTLAEIYLRSGDRRRAIALLADGPNYGLPSRRWLETVLDLAAEGEDWDSALLICNRALPRLTEPSQWVDRQRLLARKQMALIGLGGADEALVVADTAGATAGELVATQRVRALLALGRARDAALFLTDWRASARADAQPAIVQLQVQALREDGQFEAMEHALADLRALQPGQPAAAVFGVEQRVLATRGATAAFDDFVFRYGGSAANLQLLVASLGAIPEVSLVRRAIALAAAAGYDLWPFRVHLAQALLRQGDWAGLAEVVRELKPRRFLAAEDGRLWFEWIETLSAELVSPTRGTHEQLVAFAQSRAFSLAARRLTVAALQRAGRLDLAREVIAASLTTYAESPWLRAQAVEVDKALAVEAKRPPPDSAVVSVGAGAPANWRKYFLELDEAMAAKNWSEARRQIALVRGAPQPPEWLSKQDAELLFRELQVAQALSDGPGLRLTARLFLNGSLTRALKILDFARAVHARGDRDDAVLLVKTLLEKHPDHPMASALLAEWQPPHRKREP